MGGLEHDPLPGNCMHSFDDVSPLLIPTRLPPVKSTRYGGEQQNEHLPWSRAGLRSLDDSVTIDASSVR